MCKTGILSDTLKLKADAGEAFVVEGIHIDNLGAIEFAKILVDRVTLMYLSAYDNKQNQFYWAGDAAAFPNLLETLFKAGVFEGIPIAEGQELTIDVTGAANNNTRMFYRQVDPGDIKPEMQNHIEGKSYLFFNYGTNSANIALGTYGIVDKSLVPKEFPDFPFGATVPPRHQIEILGFLVGTHRQGVYFGDNIRYLKFTKDRKVFFDEDRNGIYVTHGMNTFPFHSEFYERPCRLLPEPLLFGPGDELTVEVKAGAAQLNADLFLLCLIERVTRLE
jgi:hypothetical protein